MTTRVLIALDDTSTSLYVAHEAVRLLAPMAQVEYLVINVSRFPIVWSDAASFGAVMPLNVLPSLPAVEEREAEARTRLAEHARLAGVPEPELLELTGDPATEICAAADKHAVDIIVIGAHNKNILLRLVDPSVAADVIKTSKRSVLVIPER